MYTNFEIKNVEVTDEVEIEGETMLMDIQDLIPSARSAIANIAKHAGKFVCHFEVWAGSELYIAEAASENIRLCFRLAEQKMLQKLGFKNQLAFG
jgi:hypothetical protein